MKKLFKVLQVGMTENIGGMETYIMEQYRHLDSSRVIYDFVNITADRPMVYAEEIEKQGSKIYQVCRRSHNPLKHYWDWYRLLAEHKGEYDAVTLNACHLYYVFPLAIAKLMGVKRRIMHSHNAGDELQVGLGRKLIIALNKKILYWAATDYWACSEKAGAWMFGQKSFQVIHNAIDMQKFSYKPEVRLAKRQELGLENSFVLGHVGRFTYQKNHNFLIDVFAELCKLEPTANLLLIGEAVGDDKYWREAQARVKQLGLVNQVRFLGLRQDVPDLMVAMDAFALPSHFEGLPLVGLEAQAAGLPCYFSDTITKEVKITELVHYLPLNNAKLWAQKILKVKNYQRQDLRTSLTNSGYDIAKEVQKVEALYLKGRV